MAKKVIIFGTGIIGSEARRQYPREGYEVFAAVSSRQLERPDGGVIKFQKRGDPQEILSYVLPLCERKGIDLVVFALPSAGKNATENEFALMQPFLERRTPMVLAGKAALSEKFAELEPHLPHMGVNATVGGATMILDEMKSHLRFDDGEDSVVELVVNGTLSYIMTGVWANRQLDAVIREAVALKFAEPGINNRTPDPLDVFKGEVEGDIPKKLLIILNLVYGKYIGRLVTHKDFKVWEFQRDAMMRFTDSGARKKHVVRISTKRLPPQLEVNSPGSIWTELNGKVFVSGGFCNVPQGSALDMWVPNSGPGNAVHIKQGGTQRIVKADGAGDLATVGTLIKDSRRLCPPHELPRVAIAGVRTPARPGFASADQPLPLGALGSDGS